jgi:hypothetical protein
MAQQAVETYSWLTPCEMLHGAALARIHRRGGRRDLRPRDLARAAYLVRKLGEGRREVVYVAEVCGSNWLPAGDICFDLTGQEAALRSTCCGLALRGIIPLAACGGGGSLRPPMATGWSLIGQGDGADFAVTCKGLIEGSAPGERTRGPSPPISFDLVVNRCVSAS